MLSGRILSRPWYQPRSELKYIVIVDFISQTRKLRLSDLKVISDIFQRVLSKIRTVCNADQYDIVYDSYLESSVNELERIRRAKLIAPIDFGHITEDSFITTQMERFWAGSKNKEILQIMCRSYFTRFIDMNLVLSGYVTDASGIEPCIRSINGDITNRLDLDSNIKEVDEKIIPHR